MAELSLSECFSWRDSILHDNSHVSIIINFCLSFYKTNRAGHYQICVDLGSALFITDLFNNKYLAKESNQLNVICVRMQNL